MMTDPEMVRWLELSPEEGRKLVEEELTPEKRVLLDRLKKMTDEREIVMTRGCVRAMGIMSAADFHRICGEAE